MRLLYENTADGIIVHTEEGQIREANSAACKALGYSRCELIGMSVHKIATMTLSQLQSLWENWEATPELIEGKYRKKDGSTFPVEFRLTRYLDAKEPLFIVLARDITTRKENEKALRQLANELTLAEERHRRDYAVALHDNIAQILAAAKYRATILESTLDGSTQQGEVKQIKSLLHDSIVQTRRLMLDLSSPVLYESGVGAALRAHARILAGQYDCRFIVDEQSLPEISDNGMKVLIYQLCKELFTNAAKHAKPSIVTAHFAVKHGTLTISVEDDGCGFPDEIEFRAGTGGGYGLYSIRERVTHYGGSIRISRLVSGGSRIEVHINLEKDPIH